MRSLKDHGVSSRVDSSGAAIGRRYARADELGIPFALTIDYQSLPDNAEPTLTLRERDTTAQIRVPVHLRLPQLMMISTPGSRSNSFRFLCVQNQEVAAVVASLVEARQSWQEICDSGKYPKVEACSE